MDEFYYKEIEFKTIRPQALNPDYKEAVDSLALIRKLQRAKDYKPQPYDKVWNAKCRFVNAVKRLQGQAV